MDSIIKRVPPIFKRMMRFVYLGYYLKKLDVKLFIAFAKYAQKESGTWWVFHVMNAFYSVFRYNISLLEFFQFKFYKQNNMQRKTWAGTGYMYEFQKRMNPVKTRHILDDKRLFKKAYSPFVKHHSFTLQELQDNQINLSEITTEKLVLKEMSGKCGRGIVFVHKDNFSDASQLVIRMKEYGYDIAESYINQHPTLQEIAPFAVNTVRIFTQLDKSNNPVILGCRLRLSVNSNVDNLAAGNLAAPIDEHTGIVTGPGVYSDIRKESQTHHPITGLSIVGLQIPFWNEVVQMAKSAALHQPQNRSIGWDIAITENGPTLIEGNHDWCKLLWQLPVGKGLKLDLLKFINNDL